MRYVELVELLTMYDKYDTSCYYAKYNSAHPVTGASVVMGCGHLCQLIGVSTKERSNHGHYYDVAGTIHVVCNSDIPLFDGCRYDGCYFYYHSVSSQNDNYMCVPGRTPLYGYWCGGVYKTRGCSRRYMADCRGLPAAYYCNGDYSVSCSSYLYN